MQLRKYRWSRDYESAEEELIQHLARKKIDAERWSAETGTVFAPHQHAHDKRLWCAEGSIIITVHLSEDDGTKRHTAISLQPGDALELPAGTVHEAVAGISGVSCYETPRPVKNPSLPA